MNHRSLCLQAEASSQFVMFLVDAASMFESEQTFNGVRDALVNRILDLGFMSGRNRVGLALVGTVRFHPSPPPPPPPSLPFTVLHRLVRDVSAGQTGVCRWHGDCYGVRVVGVAAHGPASSVLHAL